jgi:tyrosyl-tRNA synthetase
VTPPRTPAADAPPTLGNLLAELEWRGMLHGTTPGLPERLATGRSIAGYNGFDPTGTSLHVGHLVPIFGLLQLQRHGGQPVALVGGGTGMIGDPSGTSAERNLLDRETLAENVAAIRSQLERFLDFGASAGDRGAVLVNNLDWLDPIRLIDWLRDVGKHFTIPYMLAKDSVQTRLDRGLSFTEFSYQLIQATDFEHLHRTMGVDLQMGGSARRLIAARTSRPTASPTSCCCRHLAPSSARRRAGRRSGWMPSGPRRTRSTSTG